MFTTPVLGDSISVALRKLRSQAIYKFATKGAGSLNIKDQVPVKEFSILHMGGCKPLDPLNSFLSYAPQLSGGQSLFTLLLAFPQILSNHWGEGGLAASDGLKVSGAFIHIWRP